MSSVATVGQWSYFDLNAVAILKVEVKIYGINTHVKICEHYNNEKSVAKTESRFHHCCNSKWIANIQK